MSDWETHAPRMDFEVDSRLGDTLSVSFDGGTQWTQMMGFILPVVSGAMFEGIDESLGSRPRCKIAKSLIGFAPPGRNIRVRVTKGGVTTTYRPAGAEPDDQGRYWLFDIQKVAS